MIGQSAPIGPPEILILILLLVLIFGANSVSGSSSNSSSSGESSGSVTDERSGGKHSPGDLQSASAPEFRSLVSEAWENQGYEVSHRSSGMIDLIAKKDGETIAVDVKRYRQGNKVSSPAVRDVLADAMEVGADRAAIVTSSSFTGPAREEAEGRNIDLVDGRQLSSWLG